MCPGLFSFYISIRVTHFLSKCTESSQDLINSTCRLILTESTWLNVNLCPYRRPPSPPVAKETEPEPKPKPEPESEPKPKPEHADEEADTEDMRNKVNKLEEEIQYVSNHKESLFSDAQSI